MAALTRYPSRSVATAVAFAVAVCCTAAPTFAEPTQWEVKAAFLPRFARYVTWPPAAMPKGSNPFILCVIGGDPFDGALDQAARSQVIDGRRITVRRMDSTAHAEGCHLVYAGGSRSSQLIAALGRQPVLTVTDSVNGSQRGIIHFAVVGGHVRFFIDQGAAAQRGLTISSRLLALAIGVRQ